MRLFLTHPKPKFHFSKNHKDFCVEELPLYDFEGSGEHLIIKVRKKGLTTWELINALSSATGVKARDIGYAGLKDKEGETLQYLSLPRTAAPLIEKFSHESAKILDTTYHKNKIKIGHLKGNRFKLRLKKVMPSDALILQNAFSNLSKFGMPNYFGYQRFGNERQNHELGAEIIAGKRKEKNRKLNELYLNAWQSHMFNEWLSFRVGLSHLAKEFSKNELTEALKHFTNNEIDAKAVSEYFKPQEHFFKILKGDMLCHYPHGRLFEALDVDGESKRFSDKLISPTGLLSGCKVARSSQDARAIEQKYDSDTKMLDGSRRYAWIFLENCESKYIEENAHFELSFNLPKGSYATTALSELAGENYRGDMIDRDS